MYDKFCEGLNTTAIRVLRIAGSLIFLALTWYALRYTQYMPQYQDEIPVNVRDSMWKNIVVLIAVGAVFCTLLMAEKCIPDKVRTLIRRFFVAALAVWMGIAGFLWITATDRTPIADQAFIYGGASYFIEGEYFFLEKGSYYDVFPYQLGLTFLVELLFRVVGTYNYFAYQLINVGLTVGISILGYLMTRKFSDRFAVSVTYCILMFFCLPLIFYTGWVYGDIPGIFFMLLTAYCLLRYVENRRWGWLAGMVFAATFSIVVKKNSLIMLIALCLTAGTYLLIKKEKMIFLGLVLSVLLPWLAYTGIYKMYEVRSGLEIEGGFPAISFIVMGMQEANGKYGWYTPYCSNVYNEAGLDPEKAAEISYRDFNDRLHIFLNDLPYAWKFYKEKTLSQWNQPLYQSLFFSAQYALGKMPEPDSFEAKVHGEYSSIIRNICDRLQFVVYFGVLCYFLFAVRKGSNILQHMLAATIIGGFFFSLMWETKARYILPYYMLMYPLAVTGFEQCICYVKQVFKSLTDKFCI